MKYTKRQLKNKLKSSYWLNLYASIRSIETGKELKQIRYKNVSEDKILLAINNFYKPLVVVPVSKNQVKIINNQLSNIPKFQTVRQQSIGITEGPSPYVYGVAEFIGSTYLSLTGSVFSYAYGEGLFNASGTLTANGEKFVYTNGSADIIGSGTLTAAGDKFTYENSAVTFAGSGQMSAIGTQISTAGVTFTGSGQMSIAGTQISTAGVRFDGSGQMQIAAEAFSNLPAFLEYAWEIDSGVTTSSAGYVTLWQDQIQGLNFSGTDGHGYLDLNYSGTFYEALVFSASTNTFFATFPDPSSLSASFGVMVVADIISGSDGAAPADNSRNIFVIESDAGYGEQAIIALDLDHDMGGGYTLVDIRNNLKYYDIYNYYENHSEEFFVDMMVNTSGSASYSSQTDMYANRRLALENIDLDSNYYPQAHEYTTLRLGYDYGANSDRAAYMAVKAVYAFTGSLTATERAELWDYTDSRWKTQIIPEVLEIAATGSVTPEELHNIPLPTTINRSDLLIAVVSCQSGNTWYNPPDGWLEIQPGIWETDFGLNIYARYATGSEGGTTIQLGCPTSQSYAAAIVRIASGTWFETENVSSSVQTQPFASGSALPGPSLMPDIYTTWKTHNLPIAAISSLQKMSSLESDGDPHWAGGISVTDSLSGTVVTVEYRPSGSSRHFTDQTYEQFYGQAATFVSNSNYLGGLIAVKPHPRFSNWKGLLDWHSSRNDFTGSSLIQLVKSNGSSITDVSGFGNTPSISGSVLSSSVPVMWGDKYSIENATGSSGLSSAGLLNLSSSTTWTFSCVAEIPNSNDILFCLGDSSTNSISLYSDTASGNRLYFNNGAGSTDFISLTAGDTFGVTIRRNGTELKWWVNGVDQGTISDQSWTSTTELYYLTGNLGPTYEQWDGRFHHRGLFNEALSDEMCIKLSDKEYPP